MVKGGGFRVQAKVKGSGFRVQGSGFWGRNLRVGERKNAKLWAVQRKGAPAEERESSGG